MTRLVTDIYTGWRIARAEYVRRLRRLRGNRSKLALGALIALLNLPVAIILIQWIHGVGHASRNGLTYPAVAAARNSVVPMLLTVTVIGGLGVANELAGETDQLLLQSVPNRAYLIGEVLKEFLGLVGLYLLPVVVLGAAFVVGAGTPWALVPLLLGTTLLIVLGFLIGHVLAYGFWLGLLALPITTGVRKIAGALTMIVLVLGSLALGIGLGSGAAEGQIASSVPTGPPLTPLGWYADLLFIWTPLATTIGSQTIVATILLVGAVPLTVWTLTHVAPQFWYATPNSPETPAGQNEPSIDKAASELIGRQGWLARSRTLRLTAGYLCRVRRRPDRVIHTLFYFVVASMIGLPGALPGGSAPIAITGFALVLLGVWLAGGVFCLNPLGNEGAMLSQVLLSETPARTVIIARLLAGFTVGIPLSLSGLAIIAAKTPAFTAFTGIIGGALVVLLVLASAGSALAIGASVPQFEHGELFRSTDAVAPSNVAKLFHGVSMFAFTLMTLAIPLWTGNPTLGSAWSRGVTLMAFAALLLGVADGGRRHATARLGTYGQNRTQSGPVVVVYTAAGVALLSFLVAQLVTIALYTVGVGNLTGSSRLTALFLGQYTGFAVVALGYLYTTRRGLDYLDTGFSVRRHGGWVVGGLTGTVALWLGTTIVISRFGLPAADQTLFQSVAGEAELLLVLVPLVVFVNAPVEELLYRNVVQKSLCESLSTIQAIAVTSGLFVLAHIPVYVDPDPVATAVSLGLLFVLSALWGVVYARTESLVAVAAVHGGYNATLVVILYLSVV